MGKYTVIDHFKDLYDNEYAYNVGDDYPREGFMPPAHRFEELSGSENQLGRPLIKIVDAEKVTDDDEHNRRPAKRNSRRFED